MNLNNKQDPLTEGTNQEIKKSEKQEKSEVPKFTVTDRRFWARKESDQNEESEIQEETPLRRPAYVEELETKLKTNEEQLQKYISAFKENKRETTAFRERMNKNLETRLEQKLSDCFLELLEILDNFDRSLHFIEQGQSDQESLTTGFQIIHRQLLMKLKSWGVEPLDRIGQEFDPNFDEVVEMIGPENADQEPNTIVDELQKGYSYQGKLLRPTKVRIVKNPAE